MRSYRFVVCLKIDTNIEVDFYTAIVRYPSPLLLPSLGSFGGFVVAIKHRLSVLLLLPLCCCCLHYNALLLFKNKLCCAWHFFFLFQLSHALLESGEKWGER